VIRCARCSFDNRDGIRFCEECGTALELTCPGCGAAVPPGRKFCGRCGQGLGVAAPHEGRFGAPASYTPRHLAEKILTSKSALEGERKLVTVLFCDIANSTPLAERLGADAMHALLNRFFELALAEVHRYEGTINQFLGDGFMALFGAPLSLEDHARRAVLAALDIRRAVGSLRTEGGAAEGGVSIRMGLNTGAVVVGSIGDNLRMDYTAIGDTTNLAARLQQLARPGRIYLSVPTYELATSAAEYRPLGARAIKGKAAPVMVYEVVAARVSPASGRSDARSIGTSMVGRDGDAAVLGAALERLERGEGGIVAIIGEAGLGKSRLIAEARRRVDGSTVRWLEGRGLSFGQTLSYWPFLEILRQACGIVEESRPADSWGKLDALITELFPGDADQVAPYLASLLGVPVPSEMEARVAHLDAQAMGRQILLTSRRFFERLATERPLCLVFEDLHWVDQSSTELIEHLFALADRVPLLLCGVSRPEGETSAARLLEVARQKYGSRYTEAVLAPLTTADSRTLLEGLLGTDVPPRLHELVLTRTEGNPLYMEEVVRSLVAVGAIARDEAAGGWRMRASVEQIRIPDTIQGVIMARVDRLGEDVKQVLKLAAVIGRSFFYRVLDGLAETDRDLKTRLAELQDVELIRERRRLPELEYIFKHALVQEATYASILVERRRQIHQRVAESVEELFRDRIEEFYGVLAHHYAEAEVWEKAQGYLFKAGDQAGRVAADAEALAHYRRAVDAYGRAFGDRWDPVQRAALERKIGEALFRRGEHDQALDYLDRALAHLGTTYPASRTAVRLGILRHTILQCGHRFAPALVLPPGQVADPAAEERVSLYKTRAWIDYFGDQERLVYDCLALLNSAERSHSAIGSATGASAIGLVLDMVGLFGLASRYHHRAVALSNDIPDPAAIGGALHLLGYHHVLLGSWNDALEALRRSSASLRAAGTLREWAGAEALIAQAVDISRGDFQVALERSRELVRVGEDAGDSHMVLWGLNGRAMAERCLGRLDDAEATSRTTIELSRGIPDYGALAIAGGVLGSCHLRRGAPTAAVAILEETNRLIDQWHSRGWEITLARNALAEAYLGEAERASGPPRARALAKARRACRAALHQGRRFRGGLPGAMRSRGTWAWLTGKPSSARRWWARSVALATDLGMRPETAMTRLEMGRRLGERGRLEESIRVFGAIGMESDLAAARAVLESCEGGPRGD